MTVGLWNDNIFYQELDAFVRKHGEKNIWCKVHNKPLMIVVDPLTVTILENECIDLTKARWMKFLCAAYLKAPQVTSCYFIVKNNETT